MKKFSHIRKVYEQDEILTNIANVETAAQISPVVDEVPTEAPTEGSVVTFFSKLFESREMAHVYHLQVRGEGSSCSTPCTW
jgi:hypothetical protein